MEISLPVLAIIGPESAWDYRAGPFPDEFWCIDCGLEDSIEAGVAVTVSAVVYTDTTRVVLRHAICGPSEVLRSDRPYVEDGQGAEAKAVCVVRKDARPFAMLWCASSQAFYGSGTADGDRTALLTALLLADGFELLLGPPWETTGPALDGWRLDYNGATVRVARTKAEGPFVLFEGELGPPQEWLSAIAEDGECLVVSGDGISLDGDAIEGLAAAVFAGRAAAGVVRATAL